MVAFLLDIGRVTHVIFDTKNEKMNPGQTQVAQKIIHFIWMVIIMII